MDLDKKFEQMERELERKAREIEEQTRRTYEEIEQRLGGDTPTGDPGQASPARPVKAAAVPPQTPWAGRDFHIDMTRERSLAGLDRLMEEDFSLALYFDASMSAYPTTYCETVREYAEPIIADIPMSDERRAQALDELTAAAEAGAQVPFMQSLGVHIPGVGCFINGWLIAGHLGITPREVLESDEGYARIVTTASHEKWGHGFITELTTLGREKSSVQLGKIHLADQFEIRTVDTPDHARLSEQWRIIFYASNYVEEGYATWIERYLAERIAELQPAAAERLRYAPAFAVDDLITRLSGVSNGAAAARAIARLFSLESPGMSEIHEAMSGMTDAAAQMGENEFAQVVGLPAPYAVGFCIVNQIAARQGRKVVPYAVATACNVQYGLGSISNQDLENYVGSHPELNVNTRLAAMMYVSPGEPNDILGFLKRVKDEAGLAAPW